MVNRGFKETSGDLEDIFDKLPEPRKKEKRKILIDLMIPELKEGNTIYAAYIPPKDDDNHLLTMSSNNPFYFPICDNPLDWSDRKRNFGIATLKSEEKVLNYLRLLEENNNARITWQENKDCITDLKDKFYEKI